MSTITPITPIPSTTIPSTTVWRRVAPAALAIALLGSACGTNRTDDLDTGSPAAPTVEIITPATLPPITATTVNPDAPVTSDAPVTPSGEPASPATEPTPIDDPVDTETETETEPGTETETETGEGAEEGDEPVGERPPGRSPGNVPGRVLDPTKASDQVFEAHDLTDPVNLVYLGRGSHVADLLIEVGQVAAGSTLTVDYGDGSIVSLGVVGTGQHLEVSHAFEPTLTFDNQEVVATVTEPDGTDHRDRLRFGTRARFELFFSPVRVKALNDCDTFGKGDFKLTWDHAASQGSHSFKLGAGESARIGGFAGPAGVVVYDQELPFDLDLVEEDPWGAWFFAPWKWDGFKFHGGAGSYRFTPVQQVGDHTYQVTSSSSTDEGVDGDDDCATLVTFDLTLDMLDD